MQEAGHAHVSNLVPMDASCLMASGRSLRMPCCLVYQTCYIVIVVLEGLVVQARLNREFHQSKAEFTSSSVALSLLCADAGNLDNHSGRKVAQIVFESCW